MSMQKIIEEFEKQFPQEERLKEVWRGELESEKIYDNNHRALRNKLRFDIKQFLTQAITKALNETVIEEKTEHSKSWEFEDCLLSDYGEKQAWNSARSKQIELINKFINN